MIILLAREIQYKHLLGAVVLIILQHKMNNLLYLNYVYGAVYTNCGLINNLLSLD